MERVGGADLGPNFVLNDSVPSGYSTEMRTYEIRFYLKQGNSGQHATQVQASSVETARKLFEQQNPGCRVSMIKELPRSR